MVSTTRLDIFVKKLNSLSENPIEKAYEITKKAYYSERNVEDKCEMIYNEILYYYLTDFFNGCEINVVKENYNEELEHLKDVISFEGSKSVISNLSKKAQNINIEIETKKYNINYKVKNHLKRFVFMCFSFHDKRYIDFLVEHMVKEEGIDPDVLLREINTRLMKNEDKILKIR